MDETFRTRCSKRLRTFHIFPRLSHSLDTLVGLIASCHVTFIVFLYFNEIQQSRPDTVKYLYKVYLQYIYW